MAFKHYPLFLPLIGACLLGFAPSRILRGYATLTPTMDPHLEGSYEGCYQEIEHKVADCSGRGLDVVPQNLFKDIERLVLLRNNITSLFNSSFRRYPLITDLDLSQNDIRFIEPSAFYPLKELRNLDMSFNYHLVLPDTGLFRWSGKLAKLKLGYTNLKSLPNDTLRWSTHIDSVVLYFNKLSFINISSCGGVGNIDLLGNQIEHINADTFVFACNTSKLDLESNPVKSVDPGVIASLHVRTLNIGGYPLTFEVVKNLFIGISRSEIEELVLSDANFTVLPKDTFDLLRDCSLSVLEFTNNRVKDLYPYVFSNLTHLHELKLHSNDIREIEPVFFEGMQKLRVLNLNFNKIGYVNLYGQSWSVDLYGLQLAGNLLTEISPSTFLGLGNLTNLDLSSNKRLKVLKLRALAGLHNLREIDFSDCSIIELLLETPMLEYLYLNNIPGSAYLEPTESFKHTPILRNLSMAGSDIYIYDLWDVNISLFDGLLNLRTLDLSVNRFDILWGNLQPGIFQQLSVLEYLSLDYCEISYLHPLVFAGLESLRTLSLTGNEIQYLHYNLLEGLGEVTNINLDENSLAYLEEAIFSNNPRLTDLSLANNKFTHINHSTFKPIEISLRSIDLSMNPIVCNCDIKWLPKWLSGQIRLINEEKTICSLSSLVPVRQKPLLNFDPTELCTINIVGLSMIPLAVVCLVVIIVLVHHNRWLLKYKLFLLKLVALGYQEIRDARDHNDYDFDVNIIFYDDDEEWVREHLRPALEEHLPQFQRNIFGDEDLVLGMHYLDSVDYVVTRSYKTMILLSRAAVSDRWFMLKLRIAMDHVSDTQTEFVVVVFLEDIPDGEIPFLARLYLSDGRPYLHWTGDLRGQVYFWDELVKNLTINLRTNDLIPNE